MLPPLGDRPTPPSPEDRDATARSVSRLTRGIAAVAVAGTLAVGGLAATGWLGGSSSDASAVDTAAPTATPADATRADSAQDSLPQDDGGTLGAPASAPTGSSAPPTAGSGGS